MLRTPVVDLYAFERVAAGAAAMIANWDMIAVVHTALSGVTGRATHADKGDEVRVRPWARPS